jgi:hypothetical protein
MLDISKLSQSERHKLAGGLAAAAETMDVEQKRLLIEALSSALDKNVKADAETTRKKTVIAKLSAARSDPHLGGRNALGLIDGSLRRAGVEPLESLAVKTPTEIHSILASAIKLASQDRFAVKSFLFKIGAIPA